MFFYQPDEKETYFKTPIYDETADAAKQVAEALVVAKREKKQVLLQFGANWCVWCHVFHHFLDTDRTIQKKIQSVYVLVLIDVGNGHNESTVKEYGEPTRFGLPVIVVLDPDGKQLVTQSVAEFGENGGYNSLKVLAFLNQWALKK